MKLFTPIIISANIMPYVQSCAFGYNPEIRCEQPGAGLFCVLRERIYMPKMTKERGNKVEKENSGSRASVTEISTKKAETDSKKRQETKKEDIKATQENVETESTSKKKMKAYIIFVTSVVGGIVLITMLWFVSRIVESSSISAYDVLSSVAKEISYIKTWTNYTEENDPDELLGKNHEYVSKTSWTDGRLSSTPEGYTGVIEIFRNIQDAEARKWYLEQIDNECKDIFDEKVYGKDLPTEKCDHLTYGTIIHNNTIIIQLSSALSEKELSDYEKVFNKVIDGLPIIQFGEELSSEKLEESKQEKIANFQSKLAEMRNELNDELTQRIANIEADIAAALESLSSPSLSKLKTLNSNLNTTRTKLSHIKKIPYTADKVAGYEEQLTQISNRIAEEISRLEAEEQARVAEAARKAEEERRAKLAAKTRTFSAGKYVVGRDIDSGTYNVAAISGHGNFFVYNASGRSTINEIMSPSGGDFYLTNYRNAYLGSSYEIEIKGNLVLKFEAVE